MARKQANKKESTEEKSVPSDQQSEVVELPPLPSGKGGKPSGKDDGQEQSVENQQQQQEQGPKYRNRLHFVRLSILQLEFLIYVFVTLSWA